MWIQSEGIQGIKSKILLIQMYEHFQFDCEIKYKMPNQSTQKKKSTTQDKITLTPFYILV